MAGDDNRLARRPVHPGRILFLLTGLNFLNYLDRYIFFGVQPLIQAEFHRSDAQMGLVTSAFFFVYMFTAPATGYFGDRYSRKRIMVGGALLWSAATLLTALTHSFSTLVLRHVLVGLGEATFVVIAPAYLADLYPEDRRGRMLSLFYLALPCGSALGYIVGGYLGYHFGWRSPFYVAGLPGAQIAIALIFTTEPVRGHSDRIAATPERATLLGLRRNGAFWMASLGLAMITFALGGFSAWMPTFFNRSRGLPLDQANLIFGGILVVAGFFATLLGGWAGDRLLRRTAASFYLVSGVGMVVALPATLVAIHARGWMMYAGMASAAFFLLVNTGPLNAALVNSVAAPIRASAIAVNLFFIHLLGDAFSPAVIGFISDRSNLETGFLAAVAAIVMAAVFLFYGMRFAPEGPLASAQGTAGSGAPGYAAS